MCTYTQDPQCLVPLHSDLIKKHRFCHIQCAMTLGESFLNLLYGIRKAKPAETY